MNALERVIRSALVFRGLTPSDAEVTLVTTRVSREIENEVERFLREKLTQKFTNRDVLKREEP